MNNGGKYVSCFAAKSTGALEKEPGALGNGPATSQPEGALKNGPGALRKEPANEPVDLPPMSFIEEQGGEDSSIWHKMIEKHAQDRKREVSPTDDVTILSNDTSGSKWALKSGPEAATLEASTTTTTPEEETEVQPQPLRMNRTMLERLARCEAE